MAYFECIVGNGGGGGTDIPLIVNCDAAFAGLTITATQGQLSYTETCPSTSPYQVVFHLPQDGTWTISGTIEGTPYSESITISAFEIDLNAGFDYKAWLTAGGLNPSDYASLAAVFADEAAVRRLMLVHASADYLAGKVSDNVDTLDDFVANDTAMKWLGLSDYLVDKLVAITGAEAKLLGSTYWERYLKDHVPTMTSNTAPYGTASGSTIQSGYDFYKAFDGDDSTYYTSNTKDSATALYLTYKFANPICVKHIYANHKTSSGDATTSTFKVQGSNDGSTWEDIVGSEYSVSFSASTESLPHVHESNLNNDKYYLYYQVIRTSCTGASQGDRLGFWTLQFYGRSLDVSVPKMTSNVLPYGEAIYSTISSSYPAYLAFDNDATTRWVSANSDTTEGSNGGYVGYKFTTPIYLKKVVYNLANSTSYTIQKFKIQASNTGVSGSWVDLTEEITYSADVGSIDITTDNSYSYFRLFVTQSASTRAAIYSLNFYGLDYSEKEFETGTTKKWLYDHGVEPSGTLTAYANGTGATATKNADNVELVTTASQNIIASLYNQLDLSNYNLARLEVGDTFAMVVNASASLEFAVYSQTPNAAASGRDATSGFGAGDSNLPNNLSIDVSSFNQTKYLAVSCRNGSSTSYAKDVKIEELWLE